MVFVANGQLLDEEERDYPGRVEFTYEEDQDGGTALNTEEVRAGEIPIYENIAKRKYLENLDSFKVALEKLGELEAHDSGNPAHILNAYKIVKGTEVFAEDADRRSMEKRLEAVWELKKIGLKKIRNPNEELVLKDFVDFHVHSFRSDGELSPAYVVYTAWKAGMKAISVVDHNTFRHFEEAVRAGEILGIQVIPGVEFDVSAKFESGNQLEYMHMPVYFPYGKGVLRRENEQKFLEWFETFKEHELTKRRRSAGYGII
jgi:Predicted metal-dependent phosphoesterases (PHP family)